MKYALIDSELHVHQRDSDIYLPLSLDELQHVVDTMNRLGEAIEQAKKQPLFQRLRDDLMAEYLPVPTDMIERAEALLDDEPKPE